MHRDAMKPLDEFLAANPQWVEAEEYLVVPPNAGEIAEAYPDADGELLSRCEEVLKYFAKGWPITRGAQYMQMRMAGESDKMAAMVAMQKCAGLDTDDVFFSGSKPLYDQFESGKALERQLKITESHGFRPSANATYFPNLARFKGDPEAYVTRAQGRTYIRQLLERRGWSSDGGVKVAGRQPESDPLDAQNCKALGEDIIRKRMSSMVKSDPSLKGVSRRELRQRIVAQHGPSS